MCKIRPFVDLDARTLAVSAPGMPDLVLPLDWGRSNSRAKPLCDAVSADNGGRRRGDGAVASRRHGYGRGGGGGEDNLDAGGEFAATIVRVCGNRRSGVTCATSASAWFSRFLGVPCLLVRAATVVAAADPGWADSSSLGSAAEKGDGNNTSGRSGGGGGGSDTGRSVIGGAREVLSSTSNASAVGVRAVSSSPEASAAASDGKTAAAVAEGVASRAFANEAQYLLISRASVAKANEMIRESVLGEEGGRFVRGDEADGGGGRRGSTAPEEVCDVLR